MLPVCAQEMKPVTTTNGVNPVAVVEGAQPSAKALDVDGGADLRIRQEVLGNMPERDNTFMPDQNYIRYRPRVWGAVKNEDFKLYMRVADEMRSYTTPNVPNYRWPDEVFLDNLYLDLYKLFDDRVDLRIGRQDFYGPNGPTYGAGRVLCDGTPNDGSRSIFMDAVRATIKLDEKNALDVLAIYNSPENPLAVGRSYPYGYGDRPLTGGKDETEWGGGLYFKSKEYAEFPFELYYLYKRETKSLTTRTTGTGKGSVEDGRDTHTVGARVMPKLSETLSAEVEGAVQAGQKDSGPSTSGYMGYAGLTYKPLVDSTAKPYLTGACYYLSGDKDQGADKNDSSWDPLWSRWPQFSELYVYNTVYGIGYWSNLIYPHVDAGVEIGPGHKVSSSVGPMYTAVEDELGGGDGNLRGWLGMIRYDFPLAKKIFGKRGELYGHVTAEVLDPGDYYTSDQWAYFLRWEINARF
jgi:hypothetical protein